MDRYIPRSRATFEFRAGVGQNRPMRTPQKLIVVAFALVAACVAWWNVNDLDQPPSGPPEREEVGIRIVSQNPDSPLVQGPRPPIPRELVVGYEEEFETASDLASFADAMHQRALEGDDAAQYWLYRALQRCGPIYEAVFNIDPATPDKPPLRLDEALADEEANPRIGADEIREMHGQCQQLRDEDRAKYGYASGWLRKAAQSGYPLAQVRRAAEVATGVDGAPNRAEARELMLAAIKSGDAEVILQTGAVAQMVAQGESERERHEWVWEVAACQRGANCGPTTEWVRALCAVDRRCQPYETAIDVIRRRVGAQMPEIEEEARELNAHIDAREWAQLGL
jgi:hypothetical protein